MRVASFAAPAPAGAGADESGFGHMEAAARIDSDTRIWELVPAAKLREGDAESVCN
jgi:hypothetical protein